jgi:hypothetical protein
MRSQTSSGQAIDAWLNDRLFRRPNLHKHFRKLNRCGADLEYMLFVCKFFFLGDAIRRFYRFDRQKGLLPVSTNLFDRIIDLSNRVIRCAEAHHDNDQPAQILIEMLQSLAGAFKRSLDCICDRSDKIMRSLDRVYDNGEPLLPVLFAFCLPKKLLNAKGDPGDRWGSFFLLVVTDHLSTNGKRKPNHQLAYELLTALRKDSVPVKNPRQSVAVRVKQLQRADPECHSALVILSSAFRIAPEYCENFVAAIPARLPVRLGQLEC